MGKGRQKPRMRIRRSQHVERYRIRGGNRLHGEVEISGAKNAAVAIIPAALMVNGKCRIENLPQISDTEALLLILESLGARVERIDHSTVEIDTTNATWMGADYDRMRKIRASYYFVGSMLGRFGVARTTMPGGCNFGVRPIDQHVKGMNALGAEVDISDFITAHVPGGRLRGASVYLDKVSVGATMNIMIAAVLAEGRTVIENAAREPHIVDLANFLNSMGCKVKGAGTDVIRVRGVQRLASRRPYAVIPDQIETGTLMIAAAATHGDVTICGCIPTHMEALTDKLLEMGAKVDERDDAIRVRSLGAHRAVTFKTQVYPGFPTDLQQPMSALLCTATGTSTVVENIFESRFRHLSEMERMGARVRIIEQTAVIEGVPQLHAAAVEATDLRAGAALVIAGLMAQGTTEITNTHFIDRGYEHLEDKLSALGAKIWRERG